MYNLKSCIEITPKTGSDRPSKKTTIYGVTSVRILSSVDKLTDTCEIEFPRGLEVGDRILNPESTGNRDVSTAIEIREGDKIEVFLSYNFFEDTPRFVGYVKRVHPTRPILLECEDNMYLLKEPSIEALSFGDEAKNGPATLGNIMSVLSTYNEHLASFEKRIIDAEAIGDYRIENLTPAGVLKDLREYLYTPSFFVGEKLYIGRNFWQEYRETERFDFNYNIIEDNLEYRTKEDILIQLSARSLIEDENGELVTKEVKVGNSGGVLVSANFDQYIEDEETLRKLAQQRLNNIAYEGYQGTFTTFGIPQVKHGYIVNLEDRRYPDKKGDYFVKEVETTFGSDGFRQTVELDIKSDEVDDVQLS